MTRRAIGLLASGIVSLLIASPAAGSDVPLKNWTVPQYALGGLGKAVDATSPRAFIGLPPCRVIDTRGGAPLGGGIFANSEARDYTVTGICGLPAGTDAISANFTVTGSLAAPPGAFLLAYPTGSPPSPVVSMLNFQAGQTIANGAIVPLSPAGGITINVSHSTHVIMDVNGYFAESFGTPGNYLEIYNDSAAYSISTSNASTTCNGPCGINANIFSNSSLWPAAITGSALGTAGGGIGVRGRTSSAQDGAAGVWGSEGTVVNEGSHGAAGVRGTSHSGVGVFGLVDGPGAAVEGRKTDTGGTQLSAGVLGFSPSVGIYYVNGLAGFGPKSFLEPHPTDASKLIRYVSLEGNEAGTYFRGRGRFERGLARIRVPEDFRMVTDPEGLSVQVTPIGEMANVAVVRIDIDEIVVKASRSVEFFYLVQGVRRAYRDWEPIRPNEKELVPESAQARLPAYLSREEQHRLIQNGTYNADGTVNVETAHRLGWDKKWTRESSKEESQ